MDSIHLQKPVLVYHYLTGTTITFRRFSSRVKNSSTKIRCQNNRPMSEVNIWFVSLNPILSSKHLLFWCFLALSPSLLFAFVLMISNITKNLCIEPKHNFQIRWRQKKLQSFFFPLYFFSTSYPLLFRKKIAHAFFS